MTPLWTAQLAGAVKAFAKPTFENFRRMRQSAQYFDPDGPTISRDDASRSSDTGLRQEVPDA